MRFLIIVFLLRLLLHLIRENLHERFIALIADVLSNVGLSNVSISVLEDKEASSSLEEAYETNKISLQEEAESQARQALQSIVQSSPVPPPQKHQAQNFAEETKSTSCKL